MRDMDSYVEHDFLRDVDSYVKIQLHIGSAATTECYTYARVIT